MSFIKTKVISIILLLVNLVRRAFCCFKRRRRLSSDDQISLSHVVVKETPGNEVEPSWNDWEFKNRKPTSIEEHIEYYRQQQAKLAQQAEEDAKLEDSIANDMDLFENMTPQITRQTKVLVVNNNEAKTMSLDVLNDSSDGLVNELENWEDNSTWEKEASWETEEMLKETKRRQREYRLMEQQKKRQEKARKQNILGSKVNL